MKSKKQDKNGCPYRVFTVKKLNKTSGQIETYKTIVDSERAYLMRSYVWNVCVDRKGNAYLMRAIGPGVAQYLHKAVISAGDLTFVEHINGNTLDNRRANLKVHSRVGNSLVEYAKQKANASALRIQ